MIAYTEFSLHGNRVGSGTMYVSNINPQRVITHFQGQLNVLTLIFRYRLSQKSVIGCNLLDFTRNKFKTKHIY